MAPLLARRLCWNLQNPSCPMCVVLMFKSDVGRAAWPLERGSAIVGFGFWSNVARASVVIGIVRLRRSSEWNGMECSWVELCFWEGASWLSWERRRGGSKQTDLVHYEAWQDPRYPVTKFSPIANTSMSSRDYKLLAQCSQMNCVLCDLIGEYWADI